MGIITIDGKVLCIGGNVASRIAITPPVLPTLAIDSPTSVEEGSGDITFTVTLSVLASEDVTVAYTTSDGTALAGTNYTNTSGTLTITAGQTTGTITVPVLNPSGYHGTKQFTVTISNADHNGTTLTITQSTGTGTILDNESAPSPVTVSVNSPSAVEEGTGNITFTITLSEVASHDVTVDYATSNGTAISGTNYTSASGTKTITQGTTTGTVVVTVLNPSGYHGSTTFSLTLSNAASNGSSLIITTAVGTGTINDDELPSGNHGYFDALVARGDFWKGFSLRPVAGQLVGTPYYEKQLDYPLQGGYHDSNAGAKQWIYNPGADGDAHAQDACKMIIPAFIRLGDVPGGTTATLTSDIGDSDTTFNVTTLTSTYAAPRDIRIDGEVMRVTGYNLPAQTVTVIRGRAGTTATSHTAGTQIYISINSCTNQLRIPIGTTDGHTYLFTWDAYWTDSYMSTGLTNHKTFQLCCNSTQWFQPDVLLSYSDGTRFAKADARSYLNIGGGADWSLTDGSTHGPGVTGQDPLRPKVGNFDFIPNRWTRFWVRVVQRANDYDTLDMWIADEVVDAVQIYDTISTSVKSTGGTPNQINKFWFEYNTSSGELTRTDQRDLVAYVRNLAVLMDPPTDLSSLLVKPQ